MSSFFAARAIKKSPTLSALHERSEKLISEIRQELYDIAWLADYGLRAWTMSSKNEIRVGDRLPRERAEILSDLLDRFERKVADLLSEREDD